MVTGENKEKI
jgi:hypothetical protein